MLEAILIIATLLMVISYINIRIQLNECERSYKNQSQILRYKNKEIKELEKKEKNISKT